MSKKVVIDDPPCCSHVWAEHTLYEYLRVLFVPNTWVMSQSTGKIAQGWVAQSSSDQSTVQGPKDNCNRNPGNTKEKRFVRLQVPVTSDILIPERIWMGKLWTTNQKPVPNASIGSLLRLKQRYFSQNSQVYWFRWIITIAVEHIKLIDIDKTISMVISARSISQISFS